jgi:hypothetical protein
MVRSTNPPAGAHTGKGVTMKAIVPIILAVLFTSCGPMFNSIIDEMNYNNIDGMELYNGDFSDITRPSRIGRWIYDTIEYKLDTSDHWQTPEETLTLGTGDCEDMALLYINILYLRFGEKADMATVDSERTVVKGGYYNHMVVSLQDGRLINAQGGSEFHGEVKFLYTFDEIFTRGTK